MTRFVSVVFSALKFLFGDKDVFSLLSTGRAFFTWEVGFLLPGGTQEGLSVFELAVSQIASIQNNQYATVSHCGCQPRAPQQLLHSKDCILLVEGKALFLL